MDEILKGIQSRISATEERLSKDPEFQKLQKLKEMQEYHVAHMAAVKELLEEDEPSLSQEVDSPPKAKSKKSKRRGSKTKQKTSPTELIVSNACRIISEYGEPMPLGKLHDALTERGLVIGGENPKANLSSKLSLAEEVYNDKPHGWRLTARKSERSENAEGLTNGVARPSQSSGAE